MSETSNVVEFSKPVFEMPINVGIRGGDLPTRYFAAMALLLLTAMAFPPLGFSLSAVKISALLIGMCGTVLLMCALVFSLKTHYAGLLLIPAPFVILALVAWKITWLAVLMGLTFISMVAFNLVTKRCGVNRLFGIISSDGSAACETPAAQSPANLH
ncbi:MAG: hypothetical protein AAB354_11005 [candidate division KSB1 bacterium]